MRYTHYLKHFGLGLLFALGIEAAASGSWGFSDASVSVHGKGSGVGAGTKEKCVLSTLHIEERILTMNSLG